MQEVVEKIARVTYSYQVSSLVQSIESFHLKGENVIVIFVNILTSVFIFGYAYRKSGLA